MTLTDGVATLGIPAYRAASFIDRTLACARAQTYLRIRIAVSIDASDDGTEEICRAHAREDPRVVVVAHHDRLGWVDNVNHLLDTFETEFAGIYFHDDLIEPTYAERLVSALRSRPDAASAHCSVVLDDRSGSERVRDSVDYDGSATERLLRFLVDRRRGSLLRSLVRRASPAASLRMTPAAAGYEMGLVAAGPAVRVDEALYRRWTKRSGGLTVGMNAQPLSDALNGLRFNAAVAQQVIDGIDPSPGERELLEFGLALYVTSHLRSLEMTYATTALIELHEVLDQPTVVRLPAAVEHLTPELRDLCVEEFARAQRVAVARARKLSA